MRINYVDFDLRSKTNGYQLVKQLLHLLFTGRIKTRNQAIGSGVF
jgi:hypothetical protein